MLAAVCLRTPSSPAKHFPLPQRGVAVLFLLAYLSAGCRLQFIMLLISRDIVIPGFGRSQGQRCFLPLFTRCISLGNSSVGLVSGPLHTFFFFCAYLQPNKQSKNKLKKLNVTFDFKRHSNNKQHAIANKPKLKE